MHPLSRSSRPAPSCDRAEQDSHDDDGRRPAREPGKALGLATPAAGTRPGSSQRPPALALGAAPSAGASARQRGSLHKLLTSVLREPHDERHKVVLDGKGLARLALDVSTGSAQRSMAFLARYIWLQILEEQPPHKREQALVIGLVYAEALIVSMPSNNGMSVAQLVDVCQRVFLLSGGPLEDMARATNELRASAGVGPYDPQEYASRVKSVLSGALPGPSARTPSEPPRAELKRPAAADELAQLEEQLAVVNLAGMCISMLRGLQLHRGLGQRPGTYDRLSVRPLQPGELQETFARLAAHTDRGAHACARVFEAVTQQPELAPDVLRCIQKLVADNVTYKPQFDRLHGVWQPAVAVLLSLPEEFIRKVVLTPASVQMLVDQSELVLGLLYDMGAKDGVHADMQALRARGGSAAEQAAMLRVFARRFAKTRAGSELHEKFNQSLNILMVNAQRFVEFVDMPQAHDADNNATPLIDLLDRHVPRPTLPVPPVLLFEPERQHEPAEPTGQAQKSAPAPALTVHMSRDAPALPRPDAEIKRERPPAQELAPDGAALRPHKQPGSRPLEQPSHNHAQNRRRLKKSDAKGNVDRYQAVASGLIGPWDSWGAVKAQLAELKLHARYVRNLGDTQVSGGKLVTQAQALGLA